MKLHIVRDNGGKKQLWPLRADKINLGIYSREPLSGGERYRGILKAEQGAAADANAGVRRKCGIRKESDCWRADGFGFPRTIDAEFVLSAVV